MPRRKYPHLESYLESVGRRTLSIMEMPTNEATARIFIECLESDLSPENLHCDGEISQSEAQQKYYYYMGVKGDLELILRRKIELEY